MAAYLISDVGAVSPADEDAWRAYLAVAPATLEKYGGRYLARGGAVNVIEGDWHPHAIVIVEFPDQTSIERWYSSPEYAEGLRIRANSTLQRNLISAPGADDSSPDNLLGSGAGKT